MKSITIHKLSRDVANAIEEIAQKTGLSQNKVIKKLLRRGLGLDEKEPEREDFSEFSGVWAQDQLEEFESSIEAFEQIDEELWK